MDAKEILTNILEYLKEEQEELIVNGCNNINEPNLAIATVSRLGLIHDITIMIENVLENN
jgi:metal-sulfur cluster biosynthetic enzyme